jgi:amidophosphoribosyltransferase
VSPCYYGVDTPDTDELIAARMSVAEVCRFIEADSLGYLSLEGMLEAGGFDADSSCVACWTGRYPTRINSSAETQYAREHEPVPSD